jgi:hypothetical protein
MNTPNPIQNQKGFSLMEAMFVIFLSGMVGYVLFASSQAGNSQVNTQEARMVLMDSGRESIYKMTQEIRLSAPTRITVAGDHQSITFTVPDPENLIITDPEEDETAYAVKWDDAHVIEYALGGIDDRQIIRTDTSDNNSTTVIGNNVSSMEFLGDTAQPHVVTITLGLQKQDSKGRNIPADPLEVIARAEVRNV